MYTQCPQCQAIFQVTAEHLKAAAGDVRCGQCLTVFNALDRLSEALPAQIPAAPEPEQIDTAAFDADPFADWTPPPEPEVNVDVSPAEQALGDMDSSVVDVDEYHVADSAEIDDEFADIAKAAAELYPEEAAPARTRSGSYAKSGDTAESRKTSQVPSVILEDLAREKAERLRPSGTPWAVGSVLLMLVFLAQAIYFARDDLARDPKLRPWLETACAYVGCTLSQPVETGKIEILGWDVRSHPIAAKALVASTTLINNAAFAQPYPLLELRFSDMNGTPLAQRRFKPREYLPTGTDFHAGMPPDTPIQVKLELMDPGSAAVNFEFHAIPNPSTASQHS